MSHTIATAAGIAAAPYVLSDPGCTKTTPPTRDECVSNLIHFLARQAAKTHR